MNIAKSQKESLMSTYIKRVYLAVNSIHNKVFFNQASKNYATPDRENEIIAMLTEQDSTEVALLRITREIVIQAEKELPEKKIKITKQNKNELIEEFTARQTQSKEKEVQQQILINRNHQEEAYEAIQKVENKEMNRRNT